MRHREATLVMSRTTDRLKSHPASGIRYVSTVKGEEETLSAEELRPIEAYWRAATQ